MKKRHPRQQADTPVIELMAALGAVAFNETWKQRRSQFYHSKAWRILRGATRTAAEGRCRRCGNTCNLTGHAHHIKPLKNNWQLRLDPANVEWLCAPCHRHHHHIGH